MWIVMMVEKRVEITLPGMRNCDVPLQWSEGMIGALPVFDNKDDAERYADGSAVVVEVGEAPSIQDPPEGVA